MAKRKFTNLPLRVRQPENFETAKERFNASVFDCGWMARHNGEPFDGTKGGIWAAGWLAGNAAWLQRHIAVYGS
jgi:hypothetical protein